MLATNVAAENALLIWLYEAGTEASEKTLYVDPTMIGNATITGNKGNFTIKPYSE